MDQYTFDKIKDLVDGYYHDAATTSIQAVARSREEKFEEDLQVARESVAKFNGAAEVAKLLRAKDLE